MLIKVSPDTFLQFICIYRDVGVLHVASTRLYDKTLMCPYLFLNHFAIYYFGTFLRPDAVLSPNLCPQTCLLGLGQVAGVLGGLSWDCQRA